MDTLRCIKLFLLTLSRRNFVMSRFQLAYLYVIIFFSNENEPTSRQLLYTRIILYNLTPLSLLLLDLVRTSM